MIRISIISVFLVEFLNKLLLKSVIISLSKQAHRKTSADPEGGDRGSGPPLENHKIYGFL